MNKIKKLINENNENLIGSWTLNMIPLNEKGARFTGKLFVSDKKLYFESQFDTSLKGTVNSLIASVGAASGNSLLVSQEIIKQWEDLGVLIIPKSEIKEITEKSSFLKKTVTVTLTDGIKYKFDYGMLSVKKIIEAIKK